jgi:hypothetical protein
MNLSYLPDNLKDKPMVRVKWVPLAIKIAYILWMLCCGIIAVLSLDNSRLINLANEEVAEYGRINQKVNYTADQIKAFLEVRQGKRLAIDYSYPDRIMLRNQIGKR